MIALSMCLLFSTTNAQTGLIRYNISNGLTQNSVTCIFKDKKGLVWIGTQDGLNRFDGSLFKHFKYSEKDSTSISDQYITSIQEDGEGNLLVGTRNGLNVFSAPHGNFRRIYPNPDYRNTIQYEFSDMKRRPNGNLIIAGSVDLYEWDCKKKQISILQKNVGLLNSFSIWKDKFIFLESNKDIQSIKLDGFKKNGGMKPLKIQNLYRNQYADRNGQIWIVENSTSKKTIISIYSPEKNTCKYRFIEIPTRVFHINFDAENKAWLSTPEGIKIIDKAGSIKPLEIDGKKIQAAVLTTYTDWEGLTWIGFANNGLAIYNPHSIAFSLQSTGVSDDPVFGSIHHSHGDTWMGATSGLYIQKKNCNKSIKIHSTPTTAITEGEAGTVWVGVKGEGILQLNEHGKIIQRHSYEKLGIPSTSVFHLQYQHDLQTLFASTPIGLLAYSNVTNQWFRYSNDSTLEKHKRLSGFYVVHSFTDSKKRTWISSNNGIDLMNTDKKISLRFNSSSDTCTFIKRTIVTGSCEDRLGRIWISTLSNGIYTYSNGNFTHWTEEEGLSSNVVYGVACDTLGRIWIATTSGMNVFDVKTNKIYQLSQHDGMPMVDFSLSSMYSDSQGNISVGTSDGLLNIQTAKVVFEGKPLTTIIDNIFINFNAVEVKNDYDLSASQKYFAVEFSAPCYISPQKVIHQYRLKGYDESWITTGAETRRITFNNLPYGECILEIRSAIGLDKISDAPITALRIYHDSPFFRKPIFIVLTFISLILLITSIVRYYSRKKLSKKLRESELQQRILKERERISRDLHDNLGAYAAAIKSNVVYLEKIQEQDPVALLHVKENAEEMVSALRETIWALQHESIYISALSDRIKKMIHRLQPNFPLTQINSIENISNDCLLSTAESVQLLRIIQEAITNALKHSLAGEINISIKSGKKVELIVQDNGTGFDTGTASGGYGMKNMQSRAAEIGWKIYIQSNKTGTGIFLIKE